jgi:hypothetical protein
MATIGTKRLFLYFREKQLQTQHQLQLVLFQELHQTKDQLQQLF